MITPLEAATLAQVHNPGLAAYARQYLDIYANFLNQVRQTGLPLAEQDERPAARQLIAELQARGVQVRNHDRSLVLNRISPACEGCQTGVGSVTFFLSLRCHRSCFYCFNPNQEEYEDFHDSRRDATGELRQIYNRGQKIKYLALSGGEPLLYKPETVRFFDYAARRFPEAHKRLYTCGDHLDRNILAELRAAGLSEIRLSIRMHDLEKGQRTVFERLALAREYIPTVMVEMPVLPNTQEAMQEVLLELDRLEIHSVNLLEFCFPFQNAQVFRQRGYQVKNPPYRVLYNYWYAGGLPIAGSELECLNLLSFAVDQGLRLGIHYCSLENKHTGQLYQQNAHQPLPRAATFSEKDYLLKSAKVFGAEIDPVREALLHNGYTHYSLNKEYGFIEFPVQQIPALQALPVEIGISSSVVEMREGERCYRELALDLTTPQTFDLSTDI